MDAVRKELPKHHSIRWKADGIPQHKLGAKSPPEEPKIGWVAAESIDAARDQDMVVPFCRLDNVVEVLSSLGHCCRSDILAGDSERNAYGDGNG